MAHGENFQRDNPIGYAAFEMAQVFENNLDGNGNLTVEGFMFLSQIFGRTAPEDRGDVFVQFLSLLDEKGIDYDVTQFMSEVSVH